MHVSEFGLCSCSFDRCCWYVLKSMRISCICVQQGYTRRHAKAAITVACAIQNAQKKNQSHFGQENKMRYRLHHSVQCILRQEPQRATQCAIDFPEIIAKNRPIDIQMHDIRFHETHYCGALRSLKVRSSVWCVPPANESTCRSKKMNKSQMYSVQWFFQYENI